MCIGWRPGVPHLSSYPAKFRAMLAYIDLSYGTNMKHSPTFFFWGWKEGSGGETERCVGCVFVFFLGQATKARYVIATF